MEPIVNSPILLPETVSCDYLLHHRVCPARARDDGTVIVAVTKTTVHDALEELAAALGAAIVTEDVSEAELEQLIERVTGMRDRRLELAAASDDRGYSTDARELATQPPVVRYVNMLVRDAHDAGASDIHLEATQDGLAVRFRLDGVLCPAPEPASQLQHAVVSRIKLLADLDISERRRPQDGRIRVRLETRELDLRVSTVPTIHGESVVLRLLDRGGRPVSLAELGLSPAMLTSFERLTQRSHGMVLVSGPTGSGKTTTLYAAIQARARSAEKIITVEDPIEYQLPGITQVPVHRQTGVTFATALRAILRQDPDVLMIGEMRDEETAEIAVQAAMTGHLVFTTVHTNDAPGAVPRLLDLGVPPYLVGATLEAVLAQRLVRRVCPNCRVEYEPHPQSIAALTGLPSGGARLTRGIGCTACRGTGYRGRVGIFELACVTESLKDAIARNASRAELRDIAVADGLVSLRVDGWSKAAAGITTVEEVLRVAQD